jgi:hypothetical protein
MPPRRTRPRQHGMLTARLVIPVLHDAVFENERAGRVIRILWLPHPAIGHRRAAKDRLDRNTLVGPEEPGLGFTGLIVGWLNPWPLRLGTNIETPFLRAGVINPPDLIFFFGPEVIGGGRGLRSRSISPRGVGGREGMVASDAKIPTRTGALAGMGDKPASRSCRG